MEFWAALAGALVGGVAALWSGLIVNRRQVTREYRVKIYDDLLPELRTGIHPDIPRPDPNWYTRLVAQIQRASHIAGSEDTAKADNLATLLETARSHSTDLPKDGTGAISSAVPDDDPYVVAIREFVDAVDAYEVWLRQNL